MKLWKLFWKMKKDEEPRIPAGRAKRNMERAFKDKISKSEGQIDKHEGEIDVLRAAFMRGDVYMLDSIIETRRQIDVCNQVIELIKKEQKEMESEAPKDKDEDDTDE